MGQDQFDDYGDPMQHGVYGWDADSDGLGKVSGLAVGIVLSVQHSDDNENLMFRVLSGDQQGAPQGSHLEARVLMIFNGLETFIEIPHCIVLPQGKASRLGPADQEPSDYSEDVPNGCKAEELDYLDSTNTIDLDNLSGDWVILGFIGGILQLPVILNWFPNPHNRVDSSKVEQGKRYLLRRNNSEFQIDKNGDLHLTHRVGSYLQFKGQNITIKHRKGQLLHLDDEGVITVADASGHTLQIDEDGMTFHNGEAMFAVHQDGVRISSPTGKLNVTTDRINLIAQAINATGGAGAKALLHEDLLPQITALVNAVGSLTTALLTYFGVQQGGLVPLPPPAPPGSTTLEWGGAGVLLMTPATASVLSSLSSVQSIVSGISALLTADQTTTLYRTKVLSGE